MLYFYHNFSIHGGDGFQDYLIFQPVHRYIKIITSTKYISEWKSKGLPDESIKSPTTSNNSLIPLIIMVTKKEQNVMEVF